MGRTDVPLFVSHRRLRQRRRLPRAIGRWALDSGGFTELHLHGRWTVGIGEYIAAARRYRDEIGGLAWAAPQDWMCEPFMVERTGLSVAEHQRRTVANLLELRAAAPDLPFVPVLQGWGLDDYRRHVDDYAAAGIDLRDENIVGLGSVCRRQGMVEAERIVRSLAGLGLRLHGFGFKLRGLELCGDALASSDSMAWSFRARRAPPLVGCTHASCSSCLRFALAWRERVIRCGRRAHQLPLL